MNVRKHFFEDLRGLVSILAVVEANEDFISLNDSRLKHNFTKQSTIRTHRVVTIDEATDDLSVGVGVVGRKVGKSSDRCVGVIRLRVECTSPDLVRLRIGLDLEVGDDPKVIQPAFEREEQVRVGSVGDSLDLGIARSDHSIFNDVVRSQSMPVGNPRVSTAEEDTRYTDSGEPTSEDVDAFGDCAGVDILPLETGAKVHCRCLIVGSGGGEVGDG